jgi:hypothetical protein
VQRIAEFVANVGDELTLDLAGLVGFDPSVPQKTVREFKLIESSAKFCVKQNRATTRDEKAD